MLDNEQKKSILNAMAANGLPVSKGTSARTKFTGGEALTAGVYQPLIQGPQPATVCPPRRKDGQTFDAIAFKNPAGSTVKIGLGSIFNSIRVVPSVAAATLADGALWAGEAAMPTQFYFRYGSLSEMPSSDELDVTTNETTAYYTPSAVTLATEIVYVAPRFVQGSNKPIYDAQCKLRKAFVVADYASYPDAAARK